MQSPEIFVLRGPNGAGKSTSATVLLPETLDIDQSVNADLISLEPTALSPAAFERQKYDTIQRQAGYAP